MSQLHKRKKTNTIIEKDTVSLYKRFVEEKVHGLVPRYDKNKYVLYVGR
jgi:hypothetical protein